MHWYCTKIAPILHSPKCGKILPCTNLSHCSWMHRSFLCYKWLGGLSYHCTNSILRFYLSATTSYLDCTAPMQCRWKVQHLHCRIKKVCNYVLHNKTLQSMFVSFRCVTIQLCNYATKFNFANNMQAGKPCLTEQNMCCWRIMERDVQLACKQALTDPSAGSCPDGRRQI